MWDCNTILVYFNFQLSFLQDLTLCIEYFVTKYFYAHNHIQYKQRYISEFYSRICQHQVVNNIHIVYIMAANIYF